MNRFIYQSITVFGLAVVTSFNGVAQQPDQRKAVPSLSSDGVMTRRSIAPAPAWQKYTPEGFGLSVELPGEPFERQYTVPPNLQSHVLESRVLNYFEDRLSVNVAHFVFAKQMNLKWIAEEMKRALSERFETRKLSLVPNGNRVVMLGNFLMSGREAELRGLLIGSGKEVWFISVQTLLDKPQREALSARILESVTVTR